MGKKNYFAVLTGNVFFFTVLARKHDFVVLRKYDFAVLVGKHDFTFLAKNFILPFSRIT